MNRSKIYRNIHRLKNLRNTRKPMFSYPFQELRNKGVFITTITNKGFQFLPNIIHNFLRQSYPHKTLCIIFNMRIDIKKVESILQQKGIRNYIVEAKPELTQWACNKYSVSKMKENDIIWCKMDDDDYYGPSYILINLQYMIQYKAYVLGRNVYYVYIPELDKLFLSSGTIGKVFHIAGPTLFIHKYVFSKIVFDNVKSGGDVSFQRKCKRMGIPIYSAPNYDFIYIRRINGKSHTWKINTLQFVKYMNRVPSSAFKDKYIHIF
jgi:hypothetical protein